MEAYQLIIDYFDELDKIIQKPYRAHYTHNHYIGFEGLRYHGICLNDGDIIVYNVPENMWVKLCNLADPDSFEKIRLYVDKARGLCGKA